MRPLLNELPLVKQKQTLAFALCATAAIVLLPYSNAQALPSGAQVDAGNISLNNSTPGQLVVNQTSQQAVINWQNFDIGNGESTRFNQPNADAVALNRIRNGNPTQILGDLSANGKLMIVNPNGVFFGPNSRVDVAGLVASTADTTNQDFLDGKLHLTIPGNKGASIINQGTITAAQGGLVALVAPGVRNDGVIQAKLGTVAIAGAETASIDLYGDNLYSFSLGQSDTAGKDEHGNVMTSAVENKGMISVGGGNVLLTANVAKNVVDHAINTSGVIEATEAYMDGGSIVLDGGQNNVKVAGSLDASGQKAGKVAINGDSVELAGANVKSYGTKGDGVSVTAAKNVALTNSQMYTTDSDVTVNGVDVTMTDSSIYSGTGNANVNNSGVFASNKAGVVGGANVTIHQNSGGSIQNAIDAIGSAGTSKVQLGAGTWFESVPITIARNNFTLNGNNAAGNGLLSPNNTNVQTNAIEIKNGYNVTISNLTRAAGPIGIDIADSSNVNINNIIFFSLSTAVRMNNVQASNISNNSFSNTFLVGIDSTNGLLNTFSNNVLNAMTGIKLNGDKDNAINNNQMHNGILGISLTNVDGAPITNNRISTSNGIFASGGDSLVIDHNTFRSAITGVDAANVEGLKVTNNNFDKVTSSAGVQAVRATGGVNMVIAGNNVSNFQNGIAANNSTDTQISNNTVTNVSGDAISGEGNTNTYIYGNNVNGSANGIHLVGNTNTTLQANTVKNATTGFLADASTILYVLENVLDSNVTGASISHSDNAVVANNTFTNNGAQGLLVGASNGVSSRNNSFTGNNTGAVYLQSDNATLSQDYFSGNNQGVDFNGSKNARLEEVTMELPAGAGGIALRNGSTDARVRGLTITGGNLGVLLEGAGSSMQFESDTSRFSGQQNYFIVRDNAMLGDTLDASHQIFEGVRATDFTVAQRDAAEDITLDVQDLPGRGDVFYKDFPATTTPSGNTDAFLQYKNDPYREGLFSYAGRTIANNLAETPYTFQVGNLNLSLLKPAGVAAGAKLSPAQLASLAPAAGGANAEALAALEPSAGGSQFNCGNNFLDDGFNKQFDYKDCVNREKATNRQ